MAANLALVQFLGLVMWLVPGGAGRDEAELAKKAREVLRANCYRCHGQDGADEGGFNYVLDRQQLLGRKKVVPGDVAKSRLFRRLTSASNPMPPEEESVRPSADDIGVLKQWIEAGAPDFNPPAGQRELLSPADVYRSIHEDLEQLTDRDRRFARYFSIAHLYNAGLSDDELRSYRHGLSKLVNSLSWGKRVVAPHPADPRRTIFRIDLRDYQWNEQVWESVVAVYPYGMTLETEPARACRSATQCKMPVVRADWFVAAAARPPLYHQVLQLPATDRELERLLRVDVAENIRQERVVRAGFNGSGVSRNNRLIERHESGHDRAIADYTVAIRLDPQEAIAYNNGGLAHHERKDYDRAIADFTDAIRLDANYAVAYCNRGLSQQRKGAFDRAIADYTEALHIDPAYGLAYQSRAATQYQKRDFDRAIADYTEAIRLDPTSVVLRNNRGFAFLDKRDFDNAVADFGDAIRLDPKFAVAYHNRGLAYVRKGDVDRAIADFSEAIRLDPRFARAYYQRSLAFQKAGNNVRAAADRSTALRLDPSLGKD